MGVAAAFLLLSAFEFVCRSLVKAVHQLVVQWVVQDLDQSVRVFTLQLILAGIPGAIISDLGTALRVVKVEVRWSAEVLLPVCVVALAPIVDGRVTDRTEGCLVAIEHEFVI